MNVPPAVILESSDFDSHVAELLNTNAVFLVWAGEQSAYLAKTSMLKRRLQRILRPAEGSRRLLNLRAVATTVQYWVTGSRFESALVHYALAKEHYPDTYLRMIKLRLPAYVRLTLANTFPRTQVTTRIGGNAMYYGPFRTRASAEHFEAQVLDLFQVRRCQEDLEPRADHPGCVYGEMGMCLRPCQQVVSADEYRSEVNRLAEFLANNGATTVSTIEAARERLSEEMNFEEAARQHKRLEQVKQVLALRDDLVARVDQLYGVAVVPSTEPDTVRLWFLCAGCWQAPQDLTLASHVSLDQRLRELVAQLKPPIAPRQDRQEHLALLARWYYSTWRDGEWLGFQSLEQVPYRKLVRAISRVQSGRAPVGA